MSVLGDELAGRAGDPPGGGHPEGVRREPHAPGAATQQVLATVLRTSAQQHRDCLALLAGLQRSPAPIVAEVILPGRAPPA
jgi:hypothetical protein